MLPFAGKIPDAAWHIGAWMGFASACANVAIFIRAGAARVYANFDHQHFAEAGNHCCCCRDLKRTVTIAQGVGVALVLVGVQLAQVRERRKSL